MLSENLKNLRKAKGLSQEELAIKLNVVRQTVSKWEKGLSVPDSELLIRIAEELETTVTVLLGETVETEKPEDIKVLSAKLELLNEQFAAQNERRRKILRVFFIIVGVIGACILVWKLIEFIFLQVMLNNTDENMSIIGGADGPTVITVARAVNPIEDWFFGLIAAAAACIGIFVTRKK